MPGARRNALFTRPLETFVQLWPQLQALARERALQVAVVSDGVPAIQTGHGRGARAGHAAHGSRVTLVGGERRCWPTSCPPCSGACWRA